MPAKIKWIGNAFFFLQTEGHRLFVDPWIRDNTGVTATIEDALDWAPTHVLVSHGHPGHYGRGDSVELANRAHVPYISNTSVIGYVLDKKLLKTSYLGIAAGSKVYYDGMEIQMLPIVHPPEPEIASAWADVPGTPNCAFVIKTDGYTFLHVGDTMYSEVYEKIAAENKIDAAMLPLWGRGMGFPKEQAIDNITKILDVVKPKHVLLHNRWDPARPAYSAFVEATKDITFENTVIYPQQIGCEIVLK